MNTQTKLFKIAFALIAPLFLANCAEQSMQSARFSSTSGKSNLSGRADDDNRPSVSQEDDDLKYANPVAQDDCFDNVPATLSFPPDWYNYVYTPSPTLKFKVTTNDFHPGKASFSVKSHTALTYKFEDYSWPGTPGVLKYLGNGEFSYEAPVYRIADLTSYGGGVGHPGHVAASMKSVDRFTYTIEDSAGKTATAQVCLNNQIDTDGMGNVPASPLVLDLDGNGVELSRLQGSRTLFDMNNDGQLERTGWIRGADGFLVLDRNGDGVINDRREMFGDNDGHANGFAQLATLDINHDRVINAKDPQYADLKVWIDANHDGQTDRGELITLHAAGVRAIELNATLLNEMVGFQRLSHRSTYVLHDGRRGDVYDVWFQSEPVSPIHAAWFKLSPAWAALCVSLLLSLVALGIRQRLSAEPVA